jgi:flagellar hook-associated protein 1 FlgK
MAGSSLDIGISALQAFQRSLTTTGQNIANVNTEGYSRQVVDLTARTPQFTGSGFIGTGVQVDGVRRVYDQFIVDQVRTSTSTFSRLESFAGLSSRIDDLLADPATGLTPRIEAFFNAVQDLANDPSSIPARQVALSEGETLAQSLQALDQRFAELNENVDIILNTTVTEINSFAESIADVNRRISESSSSSRLGSQPNDLLDQRDQLIRQLAERIDVKTVEQDDGSLNVFIGNGQALVVGVNSSRLITTQNLYDPTRIEIGISNGQSSSEISDQVTGGALGGVLDFRDRVLDPSINALGRIAVGLAGTFNDQHRLGQDLDGNLGGDFFNPLNAGLNSPFVQDARTNTSFGNITAQYGNVSNLTTSDYTLLYNGSNSYSLTRESDGFTTNFSGGPGTFTSAEFDGFSITVNSPGIAAGETVRIKPTTLASQRFGVAITDVRDIAAALPVRTTTNITSNTGDAVISPGTITDPAAYIAGTYNVLLGTDSLAVADGVTRGVFTDGGTDNTLEYQLNINGVTVYTQTEADAPLANLTELRDAINGAANANVAQTGVQAYVDTANNRLVFVNVPASRQAITVSETVVDTGGVNIEAGDSFDGYLGSALFGDGTSATLSNTLPAFSNNADSYVVVDAAGNTQTSGTFTNGGNITFNGIQVSITGQPNVGDSFLIEQNTSGVSDNRNALLLAGLQFQQLLDGNNSTFVDTYGQLVASVGTTTKQAEVTRDAQGALLDQAIDQRESVSGVNLDEEAANLVRFQQAFQAAAQIIAVTDTLFQTVISAIQR